MQTVLHCHRLYDKDGVSAEQHSVTQSFLLIYLPTRAHYNYWQCSGVACDTIGNPSVFSENFANWKTQYLTPSALKVQQHTASEEFNKRRSRIQVIDIIYNQEEKCESECVIVVFALIEEHTGGSLADVQNIMYNICVLFQLCTKARCSLYERVPAPLTCWNTATKTKQQQTSVFCYQQQPFWNK